jgi:hypothetical protein
VLLDLGARLGHVKSMHSLVELNEYDMFGGPHLWCPTPICTPNRESRTRAEREKGREREEGGERRGGGTAGERDLIENDAVACL